MSHHSSPKTKRPKSLQGQGSDRDVVINIEDGLGRRRARERSSTSEKSKRRRSSKGNKSISSRERSNPASPASSRQSSTESIHLTEEEEAAKALLLKQIEILKGDLEQRSAKSYVDFDEHRKDSRKSSISSLDSAPSAGSQGSEADDIGKHDHKHVDDIKKANEKRKHVDNFCTKAASFFATLDSVAARITTPRHDVCIFFSLFLIPFLVVVIIWDLMAVLVFEIPHLSMIDHPGFMLLIHFICIPTSMYGYMMRVLMGLDKTPLAHLGAISVGLHPVLLVFRAIMELCFDGFQSQQCARYESY